MLLPGRRCGTRPIVARLGAVAKGLLWALWGVPTILSAEGPPHEAYRALVESSCTRHDAAVRALSDWSSEEIEKAIETQHECELWSRILGEVPCYHVEADGCYDTVPWAAAVALHTSRALTWPGSESSFHLSVAAALQELLPDDGFRRHWYLTAGLGGLYLMDPGAARSYLVQGLEQFPRAPALLVALGATHEAEARPRGIAARGAEGGHESRVVDRGSERTERLRDLQRAADLYEQALSGDPEQPEAHLRLGRVQLLLGRVDEGLAHLHWVTDHANEPDLVYLAHLFIGRNKMRSGELAAALVSYRAALKADPRGQAAYVATSSALHLLGDPNGAVDVLEQGLAARSRTRASDAWWRYPEGRKSQLPRLLKGLRQEACR